MPVFMSARTLPTSARGSAVPDHRYCDLETVPDLGGFAAANDLVGKSEADIRQALWPLSAGPALQGGRSAGVFDQNSFSR
jgi:hypothetical protein